MIIVTGTKRSGTSMWMQVLAAAGFPVIGKQFPGVWGETIRAANPEGFYESPLRGGIYYKTNPNPKTGKYLFPYETRRHAVKVFIPGLIRSDIAFVDRVVATLRHFREYTSSIKRLYEMERTALEAKRDGEAVANAPEVPPLIEWWMENFSLVSDAVTRRYSIHMMVYEDTLADTPKMIREALGWLGEGDADAAIRAVHPEARTQKATDNEPFETDLDSGILDVFQELYDRIRHRRTIDMEFIRCLNDTNKRLEPQLRSATIAMQTFMAERRKAAAKNPKGPAMTDPTTKE